MIRPLCLYHANCADGFASAWVMRKYFKKCIDFVAVSYNQPLPAEVIDRHIIVVDFSYPAEVTKMMLRQCKSVLVLDHHKTAKAELDEFMQAPADMDFWTNHCDAVAKNPVVRSAGFIGVLFDMGRSGAGLVWDYCYPGVERPDLINYVEDRDLWRFKLEPSREVHANLMSYDFDFDLWDEFAQALQNGNGALRLFRNGGAAIDRRLQRDIEDTLKVGQRLMVIGGHIVPVCNAPFFMASDGAGKMASRVDAPFAATYTDTSTGRSFSLRSRQNGFDVSAIAKLYGGGGHAAAAGFTRPHGWEGDNADQQPTVRE